tara:strand:+ start:343 stop:1083 length:741 start_codon:yes stop_codon:yes gene_type:complete
MDEIIGLIPSRLGSKRLPGKALAMISEMPVIAHVAKRAKLSKLLAKVVVCTDSEEIAKVCTQYDIDFALTESSYRNGTERIASVVNNYDCQYVIDIQGDEPLVNPLHIDYVAENISKNCRNEEIIIPTLEVPYGVPETIVRVQSSMSGRIMTLTRTNIPCRYSIPVSTVQKHLSVIGFTRESLLKYNNLEPTPNEQSEDIELLRALENDMSLYALPVEGNSFSIDVQDDLLKARVAMKTDKFFGKY